jgi:hypothetical protein
VGSSKADAVLVADPHPTHYRSRPEAVAGLPRPPGLCPGPRRQRDRGRCTARRQLVVRIPLFLDRSRSSSSPMTTAGPAESAPVRTPVGSVLPATKGSVHERRILVTSRPRLRRRVLTRYLAVVGQASGQRGGCSCPAVRDRAGHALGGNWEQMIGAGGLQPSFSSAAAPSAARADGRVEFAIIIVVGTCSLLAPVSRADGR